MGSLLLRSFSALLLAAALFACGSSAPHVKVLGVTDTQDEGRRASRVMVMFVEVVNPTSSELQLSRLQYEISSEAWFKGTGEVSLARALAPDSAVVVEVPVTLADRRDGQAAGTIPYQLTGTLFAHDQEMERAYKVHSDGTLDIRSADGDPRVRLRIAGQR